MTHARPPDLDLSRKLEPISTIPISLKSIVRNPSFIQQINTLNKILNIITMEVYDYIRQFCLFRDTQNRSIPILDSTFIGYCFSVVGQKSSRGRPPKDEYKIIDDLKTFYTKEVLPTFKKGHQKQDIRCMNRVISGIIDNMATGYSNNIKENYIPRLTKFLRFIANEVFDKEIPCKGNKKEYLDARNKLKRNAIWQFTSAVISGDYDKINLLFVQAFYKHKQYIIPEHDEPIAFDCHENPFKYLKPSMYINSIYKKHNDILQMQIDTLLPDKEHESNKKQIKELNAKKIKLFQPISLRTSCIPKYITFDTATLIECFLGMTKDYNDNISASAYSVWNKFFDLSHPVFGFNKNRKRRKHLFNYSMETDGIGVSLLFRTNESMKSKIARTEANKAGKVANKGKTDEQKKLEKEQKKEREKLLRKQKREQESKEPKTTKKKKSTNNINPIYYLDQLSYEQLIRILSDKILVCGDPGKKFLMYLSDGINKLKLTRMQRDTESNAKRNREIVIHRRHMKKIDIIESRLSECSYKTVDYDEFKQCLILKHEINDLVRSEYEQPIYRKMTFRAKVDRQRCEDNYLNRIEQTFGNRNDIVLVLGDHNNNNKLKNGPSTLGIGLKKLIARRFLTFQINEYNTSKKCCNCWNDVVNAEIKGKEIHRLIQCKNSDCYRREFRWNTESSESVIRPYHVKNNYYTRDFNSCMCMLWIVHHMYYNNMKRPQQFSRNIEAEQKLALEVREQLNVLTASLPTKKLQLKFRSEK